MRAGGGKNRGAAVIEFAVLLPLLAIIVFGIIEFGFLWLQSHYIANAAREGARIAAKMSDVNQAPTTGDDAGIPYVQIGVRDYLKGIPFYGGIKNNGIYKLSSPTTEIEVEEITLPANSPAPAQDAVRVVVTVQTHEIWKPLLWGLLAAATLNEISESAVFVKELEAS